MQLKSILFINFCLSFFLIFAQTDSLAFQDADSVKVHLEDISVDFLFNYYDQDGIHSPVTGGQGTEQLTNVAPSVILNIPLDLKRTFTYSGGVDYYTSASSDNINNPYLQADHVSSASANDFRIYSNVGYKQKNKKKRTAYNALLGMSFEFDVTSISVGAGYAKTSKDENREFSVKGSYYFDNWKLIYPIEHRNGNKNVLNTNLRHSFNVSLVESWVINKRMNASVNLDLAFQNGLLSTPFHRVYFNNYTFDLQNPLDADLINSNVEKLPNNRFKLPIGVRYNYFLTDFLLLNTYYRFYWDTWNVMGNTIQIDLPIKIKSFMRIYPFYRFHHQTAAKYFAPFATHLPTDEFHTSDYDLSGFNSHKFGLGIGIAPLYGLFNFKSKNGQKTNMLKSIDFRYAHYLRSDGLSANLYSVGLNYLIKR